MGINAAAHLKYRHSRFCGSADILYGILTFVKLCVESFSLQQFPVGPLFYNSPLIQNQYAVCIHNRTESMGNYKQVRPFISSSIAF